jgi:4-hydroxy-tetrahydrodipicolinate reductase
MKIGVLGCTGRVGSLIVKELHSEHWPSLALAGGTAHDPSKIKGDYFMTANAEELFEQSDALIDFTLPAAIPLHTSLAAKHKKILVIGTSGLTEDQEKLVANAAKETPVVYAANMSIGVNLLLALVEQAARKLDAEWDAEILDVHHKLKVDAPSGTSYALAKAIQIGRGETPDRKNLTLAREGHTGPRQKGTIGFSVQRGGDVIAENSAIFFGSGERLEITHRAQDRTIFAKGALKAALWAKGKPAGLYSMRDILGI